MRDRNWVFTLNNYTEEELNTIKDLHCKYLVVGKEVGKEGTPHLQGFITFTNATTREALSKKLKRAFIEPKSKHSKFAQAIEYCKKEGDFFEKGTSPIDTEHSASVAGKASAKIRWELAKAGKFDQLDPEHLKIYEYIHMKAQAPEDRDELDNYWVCGPSGCGKSKWIRENHPVFYTKGMNKWWDGYAGEPVVVLDDFDPTHGAYLSYYLKIWADHYAFPAEVKGGMLKVRPKTIIVTSQYPLEACFTDKESTEAIARRFKTIQIAPFPAMLI